MANFFGEFQKVYFRDKEQAADSLRKSFSDERIKKLIGFPSLFEAFSGASFNGGAYRILPPDEITNWKERITAAFPDFRNRFIPFGYDWLGRFFCLDVEREPQQEPLVLLFSNFTDEVLEIPANLCDFHNKILVGQREPALELCMFEKFLSATHIPCLSNTECAELVIPLYLGGTFTVENMKLSDTLAYWEISAQLLSQARSIDEGIRISRVSIRGSQK